MNKEDILERIKDLLDEIEVDYLDEYGEYIIDKVPYGDNTVNGYSYFTDKSERNAKEYADSMFKEVVREITNERK